MLSITKHADLHLRTRDVWQLHRPTKTLVLLGIIVLQSNLEFNGLNEVTLFLLCISNNLGDGLSQCLTLKLADNRKQKANILVLYS